MINDFAPDPGEVEDMIAGRHGDPFSLLGMHRRDDTLVVNAFLPGADAVEVVWRSYQLDPTAPRGESVSTLEALGAKF